MNLKKYKKLREKIARKPVDWLEGSVRIQNFCRNHHIEYIFQLIDTDIFQETRRSFKNYRLIEARLKEKTGIDFEFINGNENDTYRIIPKFISEAKQKAAKASLEQAEDRSAMTRSCGKPGFCRCGENGPKNEIFSEEYTMEKILTNDMVQEWIKNNPGENTYKVEGGVTVIDSNALRKRAFQIEHLILPDSVEVISSYAFNNSLKSIFLSKNLKKIFGYAFFGCRNIESIELPDGLEEIGKSAFAGCEKLKDISIPESCEKIDNGAFCDCPLLNEIKHPCISIDKKAYINYCNSELEKYFDKEAEIVVIPDGIKKIGYEAFMDCTKLKKILIPDSVTEIEKGAFSGCSSLEEIRIPTQVLKIGGYAFSRCSSLKEIIIPESVQSIGDFAFGECSNLTSVSIPDHLISQWEYFKRTDSEVLSLCNIGGPGPGDHTFKGCTSLTEETKEMLRKHSFDV